MIYAQAQCGIKLIKYLMVPVCYFSVSWCWRLRTDALMIWWRGSDFNRRSLTSRMCASGPCRVRWARVTTSKPTCPHSTSKQVLPRIYYYFHHWFISYFFRSSNQSRDPQQGTATMSAGASWSKATHQLVSKARKRLKSPVDTVLSRLDKMWRQM